MSSIREKGWMHDEKGAFQSRKTVCLVDDEVDITTIIKKALEQDGSIVHDYNDPIKAWEYFHHEHQ